MIRDANPRGTFDPPGHRPDAAPLERRSEHWYDAHPQGFTSADRETTTVLFGGATTLHDRLIESGLKGLGYQARALPCPDTESLRVGKEFGNRGQCNPTYFTVGNLLRYLIALRDEQGLSTERIVRDYAFVTAGACGPCRFGMYATEYRKALRDAGFEGFRVMTFQNSGNLWQRSSGGTGLALTPRFFVTLLKAIVAADVLVAFGYRTRPYERVAGSTDAALSQCRDIVASALAAGKSVVRALHWSRRVLQDIEVDRLRPKPKVSVIGEFWAMTTEGDGNYRLQRFLESEGAECEVQPVAAFVLYGVWQIEHDTRERMRLLGTTGGALRRRLAAAAAGRWALQTMFSVFARAVGLEGFHLPNMGELARVSRAHYAIELRGGEGHMEVGKFIQASEGNKAHLVLSVKPFGCMPSSGVSDGVQALVTARHTNTDFLPIETTGDGAVNVYSRVQMALF
ncbi:MAG: 2-hydroxyglutaryl-CoA dehydratase, partial [Gammaproteobacteria bacterium]|nr:2-hydroxyglutaryl-CoA dehydratase [Gammaproteobacteria bacterium]